MSLTPCGAGPRKGTSVDFRINGESFPIGMKEGDSLGALLVEADELLEKAGSVIVGFSVDGKPVDPEDFARVRDLLAADVERVDLVAESSSDWRAKAISLLLDLIGLVSGAAAGEPAPEGAGSGWPSLAATVGDFLRNFSGLFPADELSFVQNLAEFVEGISREAELAGGALAPSRAEEVAARAGAFDTIFRERLSELSDPVAETRRVAALYAEEAAELRELPVYLQTGREDRAMKAVLLFIEIFNKVIRLIPELRKGGVDTGALRVDGQALPEFYAAFNEVLKRLSQALEDKDSILIGDLAEYEVAPRLSSLFGALGEALPR